MARTARKLSATAQQALEKMRSTLASLDDVEEGVTYGNPTFKVSGRAFAVLDLYQGQDCLWALVDPTERDDRLQQAGWSASLYDPRKAALCCDLDAVDWRRTKGYLRGAYQLAKAPNPSARPASKRCERYVPASSSRPASPSRTAAIEGDLNGSMQHIG